MEELRSVLMLISQEFPDIEGITRDGYVEREYGTRFLKKEEENQYTEKAWDLAMDLYFSKPIKDRTEKLVEIRKLNNNWVLLLMNSMYEERFISVL